MPAQGWSAFGGKIFLGTDHAGFELKEAVKEYLIELKYEVEDFGNSIYDDGDDYPDFVLPVAKRVSSVDGLGIVFGGSGQGEAIVANRIKGVRAVVIYHYNEDIIRLSKEHNNANILSFGARFLNKDEVKNAIKLWLDTKFTEDERHIRRILKIDNF